jgi:O-antigen/teichoic acid export membrane protein
MNSSYARGAAEAVVLRPPADRDTTVESRSGSESPGRLFVLRQATLFGGEAFSKLCTMIAFAYLARVLTPSDFGLIELSLSVIVFFVLGVENGLGSYGARLVALAPASVSTLIPQVILLRGVFMVPAYLVILFLSNQYGMAGVGVLAVYGFTVCLVPFFNQWVFQGLRQMHWVAAGTALRNLLFAGFVLFVITPGADPRWVAVAEIFGALGLAVLNAVVLHRILRVKLNWQGALRGSVSLFRETWSLGASNITLTCLWYAPTVVLGAFAGTEQVAWLAAPLRIVLALNMFVSMYFFNMLPNLTRELKDGVDAWRVFVHRSLQTSMWLAFTAALGGTLAAPFIVTTLYGHAFAASALPLQIMIWMIPLGWFSGNFRYSLIATGNQRTEFIASAITGVVTPLLVIVLATRAQSTGAAAALVAGGVLYAVLSVIAVRRRVGSFPVLPAISTALSWCLACLALGLLVSMVAGELAGTLVGCLTYLGIALNHENELAQMIRFRARRMLRAYSS